MFELILIEIIDVLFVTSVDLILNTYQKVWIVLLKKNNLNEKRFRYIMCYSYIVVFTKFIIYIYFVRIGEIIF